MRAGVAPEAGRPVMANMGLNEDYVLGVQLSTGQLVVGGVLAIVWAVLGYRLSENDRKVLGRTPWELPSALWAFFWFLFLPLGLILYLIAHSTGVRQAQNTRLCPGRRWPPRPHLPGSTQGFRPVRPTSSPHIPGRRTPSRLRQLPDLSRRNRRR